VADFARKHAQAICAPDRGQIDIQQTIERISGSNIFARPIVITNAEFRFIVAEQLRECAVEADIVLEPSRRDSGPAVAAAAALAAQRHPLAIALVLAADNVIRKPEEFIDACQQGASAASDGRIVIFGIPPSGPATSYGYIRPGQSLNGSATLAVDAFVEKPDAATAASYVAKAICGTVVISCFVPTSCFPRSNALNP